MRPDVAPIASCTANSRRRAAERATSRFDTFVHDTMSSRSDAPSSICNVGFAAAVTTSRIGTAVASTIHVSSP